MSMICCTDCNKEISDSAPSCPYCGKPNTTSKKKIGVLLGIGIFFMPYIFGWLLLRNGYSKKARVLGLGYMTIIISVVFFGSKNTLTSKSNNTSAYADDTIFPYTEAGIKSISSAIKSVSLTQQIDGKTFLVELEINKDPFIGGAQDWNSVSSDVFAISKKLLGRPETALIFYKFRSPQNNNFDWASVTVRRDKLPNNWNELTYHQFFGRSDPLPGSIQATQWLCAYYNKYQSSQPPTGAPFYCKLKD